MTVYAWDTREEAQSLVDGIQADATVTDPRVVDDSGFWGPVWLQAFSIYGESPTGQTCRVGITK